MSRISALLSAVALTSALALPAAASANDAPINAPAPAPSKAVEKHSCVIFLGKLWCYTDKVSAGDWDCDPDTMSCEPNDQVCTDKPATCGYEVSPRPKVVVTL